MDIFAGGGQCLSMATPQKRQVTDSLWTWRAIVGGQIVLMDARFTLYRLVEKLPRLSPNDRVTKRTNLGRSLL